MLVAAASKWPGLGVISAALLEPTVSDILIDLMILISYTDTYFD